jgi:hypothetical protein
MHFTNLSCILITVPFHPAELKPLKPGDFCSRDFLVFPKCLEQWLAYKFLLNLIGC